MRACDYIPFIIISAELSTRNHHFNATRTMKLQKELEYSSFKYVPVVGSYQGVEETSFLILTKDVDTVKDIGRRYEQDSILVRNNWNDCSLVYHNDAVDFIGHFTPVTEEEAKTCDAWTKLDGQYYIVTKEQRNMKQGE